MDKEINNNGYEYVDLGLPSGTLWATCNVGASKPSDYGLYFQWGDIVGYAKSQIGDGNAQKKFAPGWSDYKWGKYQNFTKYTTTSATLELEDDAAHTYMGGDWHIPTPEQFQELLDNTTNEWATLDDVDGMEFRSKKDASKFIFIPAAGTAFSGLSWNGYCYSGYCGYFWTSMLSSNFVNLARSFYFDSECSGLAYGSRYDGRTIRGVLNINNHNIDNHKLNYMEDKQKVYIKGDTYRGEEVIKALENLGGINAEHYYGNDYSGYYYINHKGEIAYVSTKKGEVYTFLQEFYKEIKLPDIKKWKDGDLLVRDNAGKKEYIVYSDEKTKFDDEILSYVYVYDKGYDTMVIGDTIDFKEASENDTNEFQEFLHTFGREWDFKNKMLIDWKWKPENNEEYWYINDVGEICHTLYNNFMICDNKRKEVGNCFQNKLEAFNARDKIAKII